MLFLLVISSAQAGNLDLQVESGGLWFSRNDVRIPGNTGTEFDMLDLTGKGPDPYIRLYTTYDFNSRHALRLTLAPLEVRGTGMLTEDVAFMGEEFKSTIPTKGTYKFNTYRLTYRWTFHDSERWCLGVGIAGLVRDAEIKLEQGDKIKSKDDLGFVPLLHLYCVRRVYERLSIVVDMEGAWSPMGRAFDVSFRTQYDFDSGWYLAAGYRTLEGGADNDEVYTFAWLHYAQAVIGYRF